MDRYLSMRVWITMLIASLIITQAEKDHHTPFNPLITGRHSSSAARVFQPPIRGTGKRETVRTVDRFENAEARPLVPQAQGRGDWKTWRQLGDAHLLYESMESKQFKGKFGISFNMRDDFTQTTLSVKMVFEKDDQPGIKFITGMLPDKIMGIESIIQGAVVGAEGIFLTYSSVDSKDQPVYFIGREKAIEGLKMTMLEDDFDPWKM